jgi:hypothetical protein
MTLLSATQIAQYANAGGFTIQTPIAVAIALAESGGVTTKYNPETAAGTPLGSGSRGLWQIYGKAHPQYNNNTLYDPLVNAKAAYVISSKGTNWNPWSSFTSGAYKQFLTKAPTQQVQGSGSGANLSVMQGGDVSWVIKRNWGGYGGQCDPANDFPHYARDVHNVQGDVLTSLVPGTVVALDQSGNHGGAIGTQIFIQPSAYPSTDLKNYPVSGIPGLQWYCYHFLPGTAVVSVGQKVQVGQKLAMCGYYPGGYSYYTHTHTGWFDGTFPNTCPGLGARPHGPDIGPYLSQIQNSNGANLGLVAGGANAGFLSSTGIINIPATYVSAISQVHDTLVHTPGFYGIALALDEAEELPGYIDLSMKQNDISILGQDTGFSPPDVNGIVRSVGATITDNFLGVAIRSGLVVMGVALLFGLFAKVLKGPLISLVSAGVEA